ncbi:MAG: Sensory box histidine kinase [Ignavibacteriae bacterium]|nr:MAG: Sensory box histidine kinase [Ignavibacteriota bacterium]
MLKKIYLIFVLNIVLPNFSIQLYGFENLIKLNPQNLEFSYHFVHYTVKDGLIGNRIRALYQDSNGFLWIGTTEGISIFDGTNFTNCSIVDSVLLGRVICFLESKKDSNLIWVGLENQGILKYSNGNFSRIEIDPINRDANSVLCFFEDADGRLWCGTGDGIYILNNGKIFKLKNDTEWKTAKKIFQISDNLIIIVSDFNCVVYDISNKEWSTIQLNLLPGDYTVDAIMDSEKNIWIGTANGLLVRIMNQKILQVLKSEHQHIKPLLDDGSGFIWAADLKGIWKIKKENPLDNMFLTELNGLPFRSSYVMHRDFEGNLWFGNFYDGLAKLENMNIVYFYFNNVRDAVQYDGNIWVATNDKLIKIFPKASDVWSFKEFYLNIKDKSKKVEVITTDRNGNLYCSITDSAVFKFNLNNVIPIFVEEYKQKNLVWGLYYDKKGHLWCATQFKPYGFFTPFRKFFPKSIFQMSEGDEVYKIFQSNDNTIWIGLYEGGLFTYSTDENHEIINVKEVNEFKYKRVQSFYECNDSRIFIGTLRDGVFILDSLGYKNLNITHGLPSNSVFDITADNHSLVWFATAHGMCYLNLRNPFQIKVVPELFGGSYNKCGILSDEKVWGLSQHGIFIYSYRRDTLGLIPPPVYIKKMTVNGKEIKLQNEMEFSYDQNNCEIEYIGVSFKGEKAIRYEYIIDGENQNWQVTNNNKILFLSLKPGKYKFSVRAININDLVSTNPASITFTILPPFYRTWWFITSFIFLIFLMGYILYNYRVSQLLKIERLRTRVASDLHDEIATNLSSIAMFSKIVQDEAKLNSPLLERIITLAKESVDSIRDIIWTIDTKTETIESLLVRFRDLIVPLCKVKMINLNFEIPPKEILPSMNLSPEIRKNLWLILKEAVNNVCKHSGCSDLTIITNYSSGYLNIKIVDNGKGFDPNKITSGKGINSIKMRAKELKGKLIIKSERNIGTELLVSLKIEK